MQPVRRTVHSYPVMRDAMKYLIVPCLLAIAGCEVLYDANRDKIGEYCNSLNNFDDRNACRKRNQTSYQEYVQQREHLKQASK